MQWAVIAVQGPKAREIIEPLLEGIDLDAMQHMSVQQGKICGVETRLMRMSFTGEYGFEINVPADYGRQVWEAIYERGKPLGMTPYGTEAMHVLRAEKGYIIVGQDTDGTVTPHVVNWLDLKPLIQKSNWKKARRLSMILIMLFQFL